MKLTNVEVKSVSSPRAFGGESRADRTTRMSAHWARRENAVIHPIGKLLSHVVAGKTLAQHMIDLPTGEYLELSDVTVGGKKLPLAEGTKLSLANVSVWGCPACHSAHGTGVGTSRDKNVQLLASNPFYYNPTTKTIFVVSATCYSLYVVDLNASKRFVEVSTAAAKA